MKNSVKLALTQKIWHGWWIIFTIHESCQLLHAFEKQTAGDLVGPPGVHRNFRPIRRQTLEVAFGHLETDQPQPAPHAHDFGPIVDDA